MSQHQLPDLHNFSSKFCAAISKSSSEEAFLTKWGLKNLSEVYDVLHNNIQGGYDSHQKLILSTPPSDSVLTIGPGMGFCVFLLSELYDSVFVAEPDSENSCLIKDIATHYITDKNQRAGDRVKLFNAGISLSEESIKYWDAKRRAMEKRNLKGNILNFVIENANELRGEFHEKVSRIYLHKVLSSLSISDSFENLLHEVLFFLAGHGVITWAEPSYIFFDILEVNGEDALRDKVRALFESHGLQAAQENYEISSKIKENTHLETWTLLKGGNN